MSRFRLFFFLLALLVGACATTEHSPQNPSPQEKTQVTQLETPTTEQQGSALELEDKLPVDSTVITGVLDNGLKYYIRKNTEPENRAELRLAINAGSVLESDEQRGLAHLLEHMLFNGTCHFPEQQLIDFLELTGMRFGPDVNAYTSFDETVYMLTIPTDSAAIVDTAFEVLDDWASCATLSPEEIDKERGIVVEEWRLRGQNAQGRMRDKVIPVYMHGSQYEQRLPIGDTTVIKHADYETIRQFYNTWYRPDLMAVVAVGDFNLSRIETLIKERFSDLANPPDAVPRSTYPIPGHKETLYGIITDPEYPYSTVEVSFKRDAREYSTVRDYRDLLVRQLFTGMINERFNEIAQAPNAPFVGAGVYQQGIARPAELVSVGAQVQDDSVRTGLESILTEVARVRRFGFTPTELERQKQDILRGYERAFNERENTNSASYAREYVAHFLEQEPVPGIAYENELARRYVPDITLQEVNELASDLLARDNRVVVVRMPEKPGLTPPAQEELAAALDGAEQSNIEPYVDDVSDEPLLSSVPEPSAVTSRTNISELGVTELTLANEVRIVMKPTDFKEDEIRFTAFSPGGTSLVSDESFFTASNAAGLVAQSGIGAFDVTELQKKLAGKVVAVTPYIGELEEGLQGSASPRDLETMFQLIRLYFTEPRADTSALAAFQNQMAAYLVNRSANPAAAFTDSLTSALYGKDPRRQPPTIEQVNRLNLQDAFSIYRDRFADADDFIFIFVGNFDVAQLTALAQTYLGTLPVTDRQETWRDVTPPSPTGVITKTVKKGIGDQSQVALVFKGPFAYSRENRHQLRSLADVLDIRLREVLREELSGTYGVNVNAQYADRPDSVYTVLISFGTGPQRVNELTQAVFEEIERIKQSGPPEDVIEKIKEQQRRERETALKTNAFWVGVLDYYYSHPDEDVLDVLTYENMISDLTASQVAQAAREYLDMDQYVKVVLYPENFNE